MTFLPIVARELRVAARKGRTFWLRLVAALVGILIGSGFLLLTSISHISGAGGFSTASLGGVLFGVLTWLSLGAVLSAGLFFTSDCLSEEKREGTLGFLFLTDLRGYDVVGGKLLSTLLRSFYALLAVLPVLAITLLMGGVTGAQFWKTSLCLASALFCSLSAGLFVSALSRDSQRALAATLLLLLLLVFGGPLADAIVAGIKGRRFTPFWSLSSPGYVFATAGSWGRSLYWPGLLITQGIGWIFFAISCALVPRTWQQKGRARGTGRNLWSYAWKYGGAARRIKLRRKLMDRNPVLWLACRERWQAVGLWAITILAVSGFAVMIVKMPGEAWMVWNYVGSFLMLFLYLLVASQACRFFVEARRSGLTELLLASPMDEKHIVRGTWRALVRMLGLPLVLLLVLHMAASGLSRESWRRIGSQVRAGFSTNAATNSTQSVTVQTWTSNAGSLPMSDSGLEAAVTIFVAGSAGACAAGNLIALCWFGMWMGMTSRTANLATLKTFLFVQIIPGFVLYFATTVATMLILLPRMFKGGSTGPVQFTVWYPLMTAALTAGLTLSKDIGFFIWSRKKLYSSFREQASRTLGQRLLAVPPPIMARAVSTPPVIPAPS